MVELVADFTDPDANSYLYTGDADRMAQGDIGRNAREWLQADQATKEAALIRATSEVDDEIGRVTQRYVSTQPLLFPRLEDTLDGETWYVPVRVMKATYLQAAYLVRNADSIDDASSRRARGLSNFANPDGTSGQVADDESFGRLHPAARAMLSEFTEGAVVGIIIPT